MNKLKSFGIGYGDERIAFYPRMAWDSELDDVNTQIIDAADSADKDRKIFEIRRNAIAEWSSEMPKKIIKNKSKTEYVDLVEGAESALDAMKRYFSEPNEESEKIIRKTYNAFVNLMQPSVDFL